jgi:6-phosphogluconolactonase (cycloisomerase 2 family)
VTRILIGGYTPDKGHGTGIAVVDPERGVENIIAAESPSFIVRHPFLPVLYAVAEAEAGGVAAWSLPAAESPGGTGGVEPLGTGSTGGADPCHLAVHPSGEFLVTVNYTGGSVAVHRLAADGRIQDRTDLVTHLRRGDHPRQEAAHPHMVRVTAEDVVVTDLGGDALYRYRLDDGRLALIEVVDAPPASGPRHLLAVGDRFLVTAELSGQVLVFDAGWHLLGAVPVTRSNVECLSSELVEGGGYLYVANRGPDTVAVFRLGGDLPAYVTEVPVGRWPRHIALDGDLLYVANELSDELTTMRIDPETGIPEPVARLVVPSPTCILLPR